MKLIEQIVDQAASDDVRLTTLLRKCLVIAAQLQNDKLRDWVLSELNGYADYLSMPDYRVAGITARGFFVGYAGAQINDQPLPSHVLAEEHRWWATTAYLKEAISSYEMMIQAADKQGAASMPWPADMVVRYQSKFFDGYALNRAWQEIPIGAIVAAVDTVRTRLLQFALELQAEIDPDDQAAISTERVDSAIQTIIYGGNNVVGNVAGDVHFKQIVVEGDFNTLAGALTDAGVGHKHIETLRQAIEQDEADGADAGLGRNVGGWLRNMGSYASKEGFKTGLGVAQSLATKAVLGYFGLAS